MTDHGKLEPGTKAALAALVLMGLAAALLIFVCAE
jgi:hypothetical protein